MEAPESSLSAQCMVNNNYLEGKWMKTGCENPIPQAESANVSHPWEFLPGNEINWTKSIICQGSLEREGAPRVAWLSWRVIWGQEGE